MLLYTFGDSFTYGYELLDPVNSAWPTVLSKKLNADVINHARPGVDNDFIIETVINSISKQKPDLAIIAWTSASRRQFYDEHGTYVTWPGHITKDKHTHRNTLTKYITAHNNERLEYRRWLLQVILLQTFLQQHNIKYYFVNTFDNQQRYAKYSVEFDNYIKQITIERFIGWPDLGIVEWCYKYKLAPGGHPLEQGHAAIAEKIFTFLKQDDH